MEKAGLNSKAWRHMRQENEHTSNVACHVSFTVLGCRKSTVPGMDETWRNCCDLSTNISRLCSIWLSELNVFDIVLT